MCLSADDLTLNRDFSLHELSRDGYLSVSSMKQWECKKKIPIQSKQYFSVLKGFKGGNKIQDVRAS